MARTRQETRWRVGGETKRARLRAAMARQAEGAQELGRRLLRAAAPSKGSDDDKCNQYSVFLHPAEYPINWKLRSERPPKNIIHIYVWKKN